MLAILPASVIAAAASSGCPEDDESKAGADGGTTASGSSGTGTTSSGAAGGSSGSAGSTSGTAGSTTSSGTTSGDPGGSSSGTMTSTSSGTMITDSGMDADAQYDGSDGYVPPTTGLDPAYQHFDPTDRRHWPFFKKVQSLGIPIIWHQGTTFPSRAKLRWATPLLLEDIAMDFPDIRMIVAHLGHPWEEDLIALIRKAPNMYADISAVHYRPWRHWQAMVTAMEYGVTHKLLLASDFPSATIDNVIAGLRNVNAIVEGTRFPTIPTEIQERIIHENWREGFPEFGT